LKTPPKKIDASWVVKLFREIHVKDPLPDEPECERLAAFLATLHTRPPKPERRVRALSLILNRLKIQINEQYKRLIPFAIEDSPLKDFYIAKVLDLARLNAALSASKSALFWPVTHRDGSRRVSTWHEDAFAIAELAAIALRRAGHKEISAEKGSKLADFVAEALSRTAGVHKSAEAVSHVLVSNHFKARRNEGPDSIDQIFVQNERGEIAVVPPFSWITQLTDDQWKLIAGFLPGKHGDPGRRGQDNRLFVEAVLWVFRTQAEWQAMPAFYGKWKTIHKRFVRCRSAGMWEKVFAKLSSQFGYQYLTLGSTQSRLSR
jgi:transposase